MSAAASDPQPEPQTKGDDARTKRVAEAQPTTSDAPLSQRMNPLLSSDARFPPSPAMVLLFSAYLAPAMAPIFSEHLATTLPP